jgi:hypothetical protein
MRRAQHGNARSPSKALKRDRPADKYGGPLGNYAFYHYEVVESDQAIGCDRSAETSHLLMRRMP